MRTKFKKQKKIVKSKIENICKNQVNDKHFKHSQILKSSQPIKTWIRVLSRNLSQANLKI